MSTAAIKTVWKDALHKIFTAWFPITAIATPIKIALRGAWAAYITDACTAAASVPSLQKIAVQN
jgi:hypothetical protein